MEEAHWADAHMRCFGMLMDGRARKPRGSGNAARKPPCYRHQWLSRAGAVTIPECAAVPEWSLLIDTNIPDGESGKFKTG